VLAHLADGLPVRTRSTLVRRDLVERHLQALDDPLHRRGLDLPSLDARLRPRGGLPRRQVPVALRTGPASPRVLGCRERQFRLSHRFLLDRDGSRVRSWPIPPFRVYYQRRGAELVVLRVYHQARRPL
jgi:hypothetical protein